MCFNEHKFGHHEAAANFLEAVVMSSFLKRKKMMISIERRSRNVGEFDKGEALYFVRPVVTSDEFVVRTSFVVFGELFHMIAVELSAQGLQHTLLFT